MYSFSNKWANKYFQKSLMPKKDLTLKITEQEADKAHYNFFDKERPVSLWYFDKEFTDSVFYVFKTPQGWFFKIHFK